MSKGLDTLFGCLRKSAAVQMLGKLSDRHLVERFVAERDEAAFVVLIERHGPMVFGVCRRALANHQDAEDACQATFLVLARKVGSLQKRDSLGSWLHGIAYRVAAKLKRQLARRSTHEQRVLVTAGANRVTADPSSTLDQREEQAVLDQELRRLPEAYRAPLILCYLQQVTRERAAVALGLSVGSLHGRLERARKLLRERLIRQGLSLALLTSAGVGGSSSTVAATLPVTFVVTSARAAALVAAGQSVQNIIGAKTLILMREVLKGMFLTQLKWSSSAVLCTLVLTMVGGTFASRGEAQVPTVKPDTVVNAQESDEAFLRRLSKDLRGKEPTQTEIHFFVTSRDPSKRDRLIDLLIQERKGRTVTQPNPGTDRVVTKVDTNEQALQKLYSLLRDEKNPEARRRQLYLLVKEDPNTLQYLNTIRDQLQQFLIKPNSTLLALESIQPGSLKKAAQEAEMVLKEIERLQKIAELNFRGGKPTKSFFEGSKETKEFFEGSFEPSSSLIAPEGRDVLAEKYTKNKYDLKITLKKENNTVSWIQTCNQCHHGFKETTELADILSSLKLNQINQFDHVALVAILNLRQQQNQLIQKQYAELDTLRNQQKNQDNVQSYYLRIYDSFRQAALDSKGTAPTNEFPLTPMQQIELKVKELKEAFASGKSSAEIAPIIQAYMQLREKVSVIAPDKKQPLQEFHEVVNQLWNHRLQQEAGVKGSPPNPPGLIPEDVPQDITLDRLQFLSAQIEFAIKSGQSIEKIAYYCHIYMELYRKLANLQATNKEDLEKIHDHVTRLWNARLAQEPRGGVLQQMPNNGETRPHTSGKVK